MCRYVFITLLFLASGLAAQTDSTIIKKLQFTGDFRFRVEHDWNSQNENGQRRNDRSRLRYRFRFGAQYQLDEHSFGGRLRSGNINDQQGPHVTLGGGQGEFELVRIGLEKLYYQYQRGIFVGWVGKNAMPLTKLNELFWNDNVFPEGLALRLKPTINHIDILNELWLNAGHFVIKSNNGTFGQDSYLQIFQLSSELFDRRVKLFPALYNFRRVANAPDGKGEFDLDLAILHVGSQILFGKKRKLRVGLEFYQNLKDYHGHDKIEEKFQDEKQGVVLTAAYGAMKKPGDWLMSLTYAHVDKYAIVDYFAQNDWSRWDYSYLGAAGSRISNFQGVELKIGHAIAENFNVNIRTYFVEQLVSLGSAKENGSRIRLDLNIGF